MPEFELPEPSQKTENALQRIRRSSVRPADPRYVRFYTVSRRDYDASEKEGRPIFKAEEYIEILTPGDKDNILQRPVRDVDRYIWQDKYLAFKRGLSQETAGTPIEKWSGISAERAAEYLALKVKTVEQLAQIPDSSLTNFGFHTRAEREKAKAYVQVMAGQAPINELKAENDALKSRLEALEALAARGAMVEQAEAVEVKRGPGRPRKSESEA